MELNPASRRAKKEPEGYALLLFPAIQYLRTTLDKSPSVSIDELMRSFTRVNVPYNHADLSRIKLHEKGVRTDEDAQRWMLRKAASTLAQWLDIEGDIIALKPGMTPDDLRYHGEPVLRPSLDNDHFLKSPFSKLTTTGTFAENIRAPGKDDRTELRESMQTHGWLDHHPAIIDEFGVVIAGHRRLAVAAELGIEPKTVGITFGTGDPADVERLRYALASNLGNKPLNAKDRKRIAERLYGTGEWTQDAIAKALHTARENIRNDLKEFGHVAKPILSYRPKVGRPKGSKSKNKNKPKQDIALAAARTLEAQGQTATRTAIKRETGVGEHAAQLALGAYNHEKDLFGTDRPDGAMRSSVSKWVLEQIQKAPEPLTPEAIKAIAAKLVEWADSWRDRVGPV